MQLKSIGVLSLGKILGGLYGLMGLIFGAFFSAISLLGMAAGGAAGEDAAFAFVFGMGAVIILPIFYGVIGFIGGIITALLYNLLAGLFGGLELHLQ